jgi:hypothetical protein
MPEEEVEVRSVKAVKTRSGNTRFVLTDASGREFSTFKEEVAKDLAGLEGRSARIRYHEQQRGDYTNVYLDAVEPVQASETASDADEIGWKTAIDAAPYLLSANAVEEEVPPEELFEKLQPFKDLVARDIESGDDEE